MENTENYEVSKLFNVPCELFMMDKLILNKDKSAKVWYTITDQRGDKNVSYKGFLEPDYQTVQALQNKLNELKPYLLKLRHIPESEGSKVSVKGVVWKGKGKNEAFSILGTSMSDSEKNMTCDSAVEHFEAEKYSFETEVRDIIIELNVYAHGYIFDERKPEPTFGLKSGSDQDNED